MNKKTVLLSAPYMLPYLERFIPVFEHYHCELILPEVYERLSEEEILQYAGKFDGTLCGDDRYTADVLKQCAPRLKAISKWGTGIDSIDREAAVSLGIEIFRTTNAFTGPVSDSVMAYLLAFARKQPWLDVEMKKGHWEKLIGRSLAECSLGVIGLGYIGKEVVRKAFHFGIKMYGTDIIEIPQDFLDAYNVDFVCLEELLEKSDFISVNCDLNPTSYHLLDEFAFKKMKHGAVVINTARGPIIDESALVRALQENQISGAALDVFEIEPLPGDSPLLEMEQVMLAPHNSNSSPSAWENVHWNTIRNLLVGLHIPHDDIRQIRSEHERKQNG